MKQNMKKIALALVATNVVASTFITALPSIQTHAAEQKLTATLKSSSGSMMDYVTRDSTNVTGRVPAGAGRQVTAQIYNARTSAVRYTLTGIADESGDYSIPLQSYVGNFSKEDAILVTFDNGKTAGQLITIGDMSTFNLNPIKDSDTTISGVFTGHPNLIFAVGFSGTDQVYFTTNEEGNFSFKLPNSLTGANFDGMEFSEIQGSYYFAYRKNPALPTATPAVSFNVTGLNTTPMVGATGKMSTNVLPTTANQGVTYSSSNLGVMTVDGNGNWAATGSGTANIIVTSNSNNQISTTIPVTVSALEPATVAVVNDLFINNDPANHIKDTTDQVAINAAQVKVNAVTDTAKKAELQGYVTKAQNELNARIADKTAQTIAFAAVHDLFINNNPLNPIKDTTNQAAIDAAQAKVNLVVDAYVHGELQKQIDKAKAELAARTATEQAKASVNNLFSNAPTNTILKDTTTQAMIDAASAQVNALAASTDKTKLQGDIATANTLFGQIIQTTINSLTATDIMVSGKGEPNSDIVIKNGATTIASGKVASDGNYLFNITPQAAGSTITATITKASNGKVSTASTLIPAALDYSLKANSYKVGTANLTGTYGKNIAKVRLFVNNKLVIQATTSNGTFTFPNIASFITKPTDKVEVVGVDGSYVERARVAVTVTGDPVYDYSLTANDYTLGNATLTGKYGKDVSKVRLWVNGVVVSQATTNADGTYTFDKVPSFVKLTTDKVEVVGVNAAYNEVARKTVVTKGSSILDTSLTANSYAKGAANLTGTFGKDISKVRLWVNGAVVQQATTSNGNYTFTNIAKFILNKDDVVQVVGVDAQYNEKNRITVTKTGFDTLDNSLTAPADFTLNKDTAINGTMGTNVANVRLSVNGVIVKQAAKTGNTYSITGANNYITSTTDVVKIIAVDAQYKEVASKTVTVKADSTVYDYALAVNPYIFGATTITGTYGKDVSAVRLWVNGAVVKTASVTSGTFTINGLTSITSTTDKVEIVAVNAGFKEVARTTIQQ